MNWESYNNEDIGTYIVGFLDILGFKEMLKKHGLAVTKNSLKRIIIDLKQVFEKQKSNSLFRPYKSHLGEAPPLDQDLVETKKFILEKGFFNFADTVVLYCKITEEKGPNVKLFKAICSLMNKFISTSILWTNSNHYYSIAYRGAISMGEGYVNSQSKIHIGEPFTRSYYLAESQEWMGGVIDQTIDRAWIKKMCGYDNEVILYSIPFKNECMEFNKSLKYALNWPQAHPCEITQKSFRREGPEINDIGWHINEHDWGNQIIKKKQTYQFAEWISHLWDEKVEC